jgi:hypothetical protein
MVWITGLAVRRGPVTSKERNKYGSVRRYYVDGTTTKVRAYKMGAVVGVQKLEEGA